LFKKIVVQFFILFFLNPAIAFSSSSLASHSCAEERKSSIGSRKFNRYLLAIYDYRLAMLKIVPNVQVSDTTDASYLFYCLAHIFL